MRPLRRSVCSRIGRKFSTPSRSRFAFTRSCRLYVTLIGYQHSAPWAASPGAGECAVAGLPAPLCRPAIALIGLPASGKCSPPFDFGLLMSDVLLQTPSIGLPASLGAGECAAAGLPAPLCRSAMALIWLPASGKCSPAADMLPQAMVCGLHMSGAGISMSWCRLSIELVAGAGCWSVRCRINLGDTAKQMFAAHSLISNALRLFSMLSTDIQKPVRRLVFVCKSSHLF